MDNKVRFYGVDFDTDADFNLIMGFLGSIAGGSFEDTSSGTVSLEVTTPSGIDGGLATRISDFATEFGFVSKPYQFPDPARPGIDESVIWDELDQEVADDLEDQFDVFRP